MTIKTAIIGDIHGCYFTLRRLLKEIGPCNRIISVGDILDKGNYQYEVLTELRKRDAILVLGNHEEKHLRNDRNLRKHGESKVAQTRHIKSLRETATPEDWDYLRSAVASHTFITGPHTRRTVVHAGVVPAMTELLAKPWSQIERRDQSDLNAQIRVRLIDDNGEFVPLSEDQDDYSPWFMKYDGRFGFIYYGHWAREGFVHLTENTCGLDSGAVYGYKLSAAVLYDDSNEQRIVSVDTDPADIPEKSSS